MENKMHKEEVLERLHHSGYRITAPRRALVEFLLDDGNSRSAQALYESTKAAGIHIGRATVYRTVALLSELGYMERVHGPGDCHTHTVRNPAQHQHQLICTCCGTVTPIESCVLSTEEHALASETGYRITGHVLQFFGECPTCVSKG